MKTVSYHLLAERDALIAATHHQIAAMLFFAMPWKKQPMRPRDLRYQRDNLIRGLVHLAEGLEKGAFPPDATCEGCGQDIGPGQYYVAGDDYNTHARCAGVPERDCTRMPTPAEHRAEFEERMVAARAYLARRGIPA